MAKVVLVVNDLGNDKSGAISAIRRRTSLSIAKIRSRLSSGHPVLQVDMFGLDLAERVSSLRSLVEDLLSAGASVEMFELLSNESFPAVDRASLMKVDLEKVHNMVAAHEREERYHQEIASSLEDENLE